MFKNNYLLDSKRIKKKSLSTLFHEGSFVITRSYGRLFLYLGHIACN
jgi:hypothetical protein